MELVKMRYLNTRMALTPKERFNYQNLEKGYEGEVKFDNLAENIQEERYILNDLLLEVNNSFFQIDTVMISQAVIHLLDIKNYEDDCYIEGDELRSVKTGREYKNPVISLNRSANLFRQFLQNLKLNYLVEASVIFINSNFTLYQAPMNMPIILPNQINRFINDLNKTPSTLNEGHRRLAQTLISIHHTKNRFAVIPAYQYEQLQKGIYCKTCKSFMMSVKYYDFVCGNCGELERIEHAILRNAKEFQLLFPERKLTTQSLYEWCNVDLSKKTFRRVLKKNYTSVGKTLDTYYK
ncbi:nuclease-related domain-containing protein [Neobacillus endophyticus]|uniref:nuclease-related domain-containing protein n=1 Tax=Neobacillus endophyticus TaxID=2738405 RepID=UPI0028A5E2A9|nr:nuclease-related domain-containing protein [Neobacillus endophyticus]